ncbi:DUF4238 domain-containing protein [Sphingobacterium sp. NGMCC 1.201703]|uniref:DUF4238 domain-containing protein n=1 Tax=Sphingobacterium sp. NGMCC 1.201703 TaxID=3388657 RepID=UPI0039FD6B07
MEYITEKKNQHYLPKFYLKYFSIKKNEKEIGVYNINNKKTIRHAPLKNQASKKFYYGKDGKIEDYFSKIEGDFAKVLKNIQQTHTLPKRYSDDRSKYADDYSTLLLFVSCTFSRNPTVIEGITKMINKSFELLFSPDDYEKYEIPEMEKEESLHLNLKNLFDLCRLMLDLEVKLILNNTQMPFIASDFPIALYNSYLERMKWPFGKTGFGAKGLQIFIPISPTLLICIFDPQIYKVGTRKANKIILSNEKDVIQFNALQYLNCIQNLYFDENLNDHMLSKIINYSSKFKRANEINNEKCRIIDSKNDDERLVKLGTTDLCIRLEIDGIKYLSGVLSLKLDLTKIICMREIQEYQYFEKIRDKKSAPYVIQPRNIK